VAFETLFERHKGSLTSFAWRMLRRREEAEEVCLEAFTRVIEGAWRPGGSVKSFLFTIVHRLCVDRLRARRRVIPLFPGARDEEPDEETPERVLVADERSRRIERALAQLPEGHRAVLLLYYQEELASKDVAEILGVDDQQVRSRLSYARKLLKQQLDDEPGGEP
jgi:RNA polymerase sigma-70 factor (ECF subfamily)